MLVEPQKYELKTRDGEIVDLPPGVAILYNLCCGCGQPDRFFQVALEYLEGIEGDGNVADRLREDDGFYFVANVLSGLSWREGSGEIRYMTEHGSSIFYCWLEADGYDALDFLRKYGDQLMENDDGIPRVLMGTQHSDWEKEIKSE